jgi:ribosomal-protein-serine acetyltransferase
MRLAGIDHPIGAFMLDLHTITLRRYAPADAMDLFSAVRESVSTVGLWQGWCNSDFTLEVARAWIEGRVEAFNNGSEFDFAIHSGQGRFLGSCTLNRLDPGNSRANLGYWVRATEIGQGVATVATRLLAQWAFHHTDLHRLEIVVAKDNGASLRVAEKVGALREGSLRERLRVLGELKDAAMFSLLKSDPPFV